ncbi:MAG TPA: hypothetical protein VIU40_14080, partial [Geobacteraceae bacterium]
MTVVQDTIDVYPEDPLDTPFVYEPEYLHLRFMPTPAEAEPEPAPPVAVAEEPAPKPALYVQAQQSAPPVSTGTEQ